MEIRQDEGVVILGKRGSGKTYLIKKLISKFSSYHFVLIDVVGNMAEMKGMANCEYNLVNPHRSEQINRICVDAMRRGNCMVVADESDRINYCEGFSDLINLGRNYGVGFISSARRTANISKDILANQTHSFIFRHAYPRDVNVLDEWLQLDTQELRTLPQYTSMYFCNDERIGLFRA